MLPRASAKKKVSTLPGNPLPIPLADFDGLPASPWPVYAAQLRLGEIVVPDPAHARALYRHGFFGHGILSSKGLDYETLSKRATGAQVARKLQWRALAVARGSTAEHEPPPSAQHVPKKYIYVLPEERAGDSPFEPPVTASTATDAGHGELVAGTDYKADADCGDPVHTSNGDSAQLTVDPFPVAELLVLLPEEAVYLSYGLGCLVVTDETGCQMDVDMLWSKLVAADAELPYRYAAYHQLRSDGWVVRPGGCYGADYMLYAVGPLYYHSQYLVQVEGYSAATMEPLTSNVSTSDTDLHLLDRLAANVQKMAMLCLVLRPNSLPATASVERCLASLRVEQLPYTRINIDTQGSDSGVQHED